MISQKLQEAINKQINREIHSAYLYQSMAAYFESLSLDGMAVWMDKQTQEEMFHARKFYDYMNERGGRVIFTGIEAPKTEWQSPLNAFEDALIHEEYITKSIYELLDLAIQEKDHMTQVFLHWFVTEQAEEENSVSTVIDKLKLVKDSPNGIFMMDRELSKRATEPPPGASEAQ